MPSPRATRSARLTYELNVGDRVVQSGQQGDLGDAPDSTNHFNNAPMTAYPGVPARYPTVYRNTPAGATPGPMHWDPTKQAWLGTRVSAPSWTRISRRTRTWRPTSIRPSMRPIADRFDDGLIYQTLGLPKCAYTDFKYRVHVANAIEQWFFNAWFDFNHDGDWEDALQCRDRFRRSHRGARVGGPGSSPEPGAWGLHDHNPGLCSPWTRRTPIAPCGCA